ncbi:MAG TPA: hypothetical protein VGR55_10580 [Candidatus Acidoferrum sp.]|nr:hypothetical protein [Candidatus Acidoferrum sp.]
MAKSLILTICLLLVGVAVWARTPATETLASNPPTTVPTKDDVAAVRQEIGHGCNRRWELAGMNPAVLRQLMGHSSDVMTARYTGEIPLEQVRASLSSMELENMENDLSVLPVA